MFQHWLAAAGFWNHPDRSSRGKLFNWPVAFRSAGVPFDNLYPGEHLRSYASSSLLFRSYVGEFPGPTFSLYLPFSLRSAYEANSYTIAHVDTCPPSRSNTWQHLLHTLHDSQPQRLHTSALARHSETSSNQTSAQRGQCDDFTRFMLVAAYANNLLRQIAPNKAEVGNSKILKLCS